MLTIIRPLHRPTFRLVAPLQTLFAGFIGLVFGGQVSGTE